MKRQYDSLTFIPDELKTPVLEEYPRVESNLRTFMMEKYREFRNEIKDQEETFFRKLDQNIL